MVYLISHSLIYSIQDNGENRLHLRNTLDDIYLTSILDVQCSQATMETDDNMTSQHDHVS